MKKEHWLIVGLVAAGVGFFLFRKKKPVLAIPPGSVPPGNIIPVPRGSICVMLNPVVIAQGYTNAKFILEGCADSGEFGMMCNISYADGQPHVFYQDPHNPAKNSGLDIRIGGAVLEEVLVPVAC